ncbi:MAG: hypothetical protein U9R79_05275 [Armatimonadota bacterium]|nr:hypothetical protein [Armatimonadota bacterium]
MVDATFRELMTGEAAVMRPDVDLDGEGGLKTPVYEEVQSGVRVRIARARTDSEDDLLGRAEDISHVAYGEVVDVRPADRLVTRPVQTALAEDVESGATELPVASTDGLHDGQDVEIGAIVEERVITVVGASSITVSPALEAEHSAGEAVRVVEQYEVVAVEDAAGAGHHLRMMVRKL